MDQDFQVRHGRGMQSCINSFFYHPALYGLNSYKEYFSICKYCAHNVTTLFNMVNSIIVYTNKKITLSNYEEMPIDF